MVLISITRLRLRSPLFLPGFLRYAIPSAREANAAPGNLKTCTRRQGLTVFWTVTIWDNEASMRRYITSGAHRQAMPKLANWCSEAATVHWLQAQTELPQWREMGQRMMTQGRLYPLKYPSANHQAGSIQID